MHTQPLTIDDGVRYAWLHCIPSVPFEWVNGTMHCTPEVCGQIVANFDDAGQPLPVLYPPKPEYPQLPVAAGWVQRLECRDDGLWAHCEFTPEAVTRIRSGELRFATATVSLDDVDNETGARLGARLYDVGIAPGPYL